MFVLDKNENNLTLAPPISHLNYFTQYSPVYTNKNTKVLKEFPILLPEKYKKMCKCAIR